MDEVLERIVECIGPKHGAKKDLAMYLDIHPNVITNWLGGRNKSYMKYLNQIADYFGVSVDYLLTGEKEKPTDSGRPKLEDADIAFYERYSRLSENEKEDMRDFLELMENRRKRREKGE